MIENLNERELEFLELVKKAHGEQKRKYTNEPYWHHCLNVALMAKQYADETIKETSTLVALGHDLLEDTETTSLDLMLCFSLLKSSAYIVHYGINQLTDKFTSKEHPYLNRKTRKECEAKRLSFTEDWIQTIKYADLIDNTSTIAKYDPKFAITYLQEKRQLLDLLDKGNKDLRKKAYQILEDAEKDLENASK